MIDLDAIRKRDAASPSYEPERRIVELIAANRDRRALLAYVDAMAEWLALAERVRDKAIVKADTLQFLLHQREIDIDSLQRQLAAALERT